MTGGIIWYYDTLTPRSAAFALVLEEVLDGKLDELAQGVENYAQENASWEDQSGAAREGLTAEAVSSGFSKAIVLYHTVDYGIWLEVRWNGRYAIILPTIETMGPRVMAELHGLMGLI